MLNVEVQIANVIASACRNYGQPQPKREPRLKVDAVSLARVIGHDEARASDLTHYLVADTADVILLVNTEGLKPSGAYPRIETICPSVVQASIEPHGNKTLSRARFARSKGLRSQKPFHSQSSCRSVTFQICVFKQDLDQKKNFLFIS